MEHHFWGGRVPVIIRPILCVHKVNSVNCTAYYHETNYWTEWRSKCHKIKWRQDSWSMNTSRRTYEHQRTIVLCGWNNGIYSWRRVGFNALCEQKVVWSTSLNRCVDGWIDRYVHNKRRYGGIMEGEDLCKKNCRDFWRIFAKLYSKYAKVEKLS